MKKLKKWLIGVGLCCAITMVGASVSMMDEPVHVQAQTGQDIINGSFSEEYGVNQTIVLPEFLPLGDYIVNVQTYENNTLKILESFQNPNNATYTFKSEGKYVISYSHFVDDVFMKAYNYAFDVVEKAIFDFSVLPKKAYIGTKYDFGSIKLVYQNKTKKANLSVFSPNGDPVDVSNGVFSPNAVGTYTFGASAKVDGKDYNDTYTIDVSADAAGLFESQTATFMSNYQLPSWSNEGNGVLITTTTSSAKVRYSNVIDLSKLNSNIPIIEFQALYGYDAKTGYTFADMGQGWQTMPQNVYIQLTDVYDSSKYISVRWRSGEWYEYGNMYDKSYCYVGTGPCTMNVSKWGSDVGTLTYNSTFRGADGKSQNPASGKLFTFAMDYETNTGYMGGSLIANYGDTNAYGKNAFDKFTTGEVYLDIYFAAKFMEADRGGLVVTSVAGNSLSGSAVIDENNVSENSFADNVKPNIYLDLDAKYADAMPTGYVGEAYPIPSTYALDTISGELPVRCGVTRSGEEYAIRKGLFIPDQAGEYKISYTTVDTFGNIDAKTLTVEVKDEALSKITFGFPQDVAAKYMADFTMPEFTVSGGSGIVEYSYTLYYNEREVDLSQTNTITLSELGTLKFVFEANDYLGTEIGNEGNALTLDIIQTDEMFVKFNGYVPKYVQTGTTLVLPDVTIVSGSSSQITKTIKVNGVPLGEDRAYIVSQAMGESLTVEYIANNGREWKETFTINVISNTKDVTSAMLSDMMGKLDTTVNGGLIYQVDGTRYFSTPQPVSVQGFVLNARYDVKKVESKTIVFEDCYSSDRRVELTIFAEGASLFVNVNGRYKYTINPTSTNTDGTVDFYLAFDSTTGRIYDYKDVLIGYVSDYVNGKKYEGFQENIAYATVSFANAKDMTYALLRISNQSFGRFSNDVPVGPEVVLENEMASKYITLNETVVVSAAKGVDLFDGICDVYVTVVSPSGTYIYNGVKADAEKSFTATEYGIYRVTYSSADKSGGNGELSIEYTVPEYEGPQINVDKKTIKAKAGESFAIPQATVTDNVTPESGIKLYAFIVDDSNYTMVDGTCTISEVGEYTLVYVAVDVSGNMSRATVAIIIE